MTVLVYSQPLPDPIKTVQYAIQRVFPGREVVVAGGCLRDWHLGKPWKDIDVFVESRRDTGAFLNTLTKLERELGKPSRYLAHVEYLEWTPEVTGFANYTLFGEDVQIVGVDYRPLTILHVLGRFDLGLCQIAYNGCDISCTPQFLADARNKQLTLVRCDSTKDWERSRSRATRLIAEKYPGFEAVFDNNMLLQAKHRENDDARWDRKPLPWPEIDRSDV